eukprot:1860059-Prorocentrum_lima.AAC.1
MTSSLVGSEMCIRDRNSNGWCPPCWQSARSPARRCRWSGRDHANGGTAPVSYTHLTLPTICSV